MIVIMGRDVIVEERGEGDVGDPGPYEEALNPSWRNEEQS
jgi:hypothetical protein